MSNKRTEDNPVISQPTDIGGIMVDVHGLHDVTWKEAEAYIRHIQETVLSARQIAGIMPRRPSWEIGSSIR